MGRYKMAVCFLGREWGKWGIVSCFEICGCAIGEIGDVGWVSNSSGIWVRLCMHTLQLDVWSPVTFAILDCLELSPQLPHEKQGLDRVA